MPLSKKELMTEACDAVIITEGAVGLTMIAKKLAGVQLGAPESLKGTAKLAVASALSSALSSMAIKWVQDKYIPTDPFKSV